MFSILALPITSQWPAGVFTYWITSGLFSFIQIRLFSRPAFVQWINPNLMKHMEEVYTRNLDLEQADNLANLLKTG
jgi:membrane protein insertase Oxa1/YidC/SpoIIIJ